MNKKHMGSTLDSLFDAMGVLPEMNERLSKRIFVERLRQTMKRRRISVSEFARRMSTSRTSVRRLLDHTVPGVTLDSLVRASAAVGMGFEPRLMEAKKQAPTSGSAGHATLCGEPDVAMPNPASTQP
jgi:predicted XRE-type DNA-binding protein